MGFWPVLKSFGFYLSLLVGFDIPNLSRIRYRRRKFMQRDLAHLYILFLSSFSLFLSHSVCEFWIKEEHRQLIFRFLFRVLNPSFSLELCCTRVFRLPDVLSLSERQREMQRCFSLDEFRSEMLKACQCVGRQQDWSDPILCYIIQQVSMEMCFVSIVTAVMPTHLCTLKTRSERSITLHMHK